MNEMLKKKWLAIGSILLVCFGIFLFQPNETKAAGSTEGVINWFKARQGKVTYSMYNRNGPSSYDCSSAVYYALIEAGFLPKGTAIGNTESLYALEGKLLTPISRAEVKRGDIFVSGSKGGSSGGNGHTGVFMSNSTIIHCNYGSNGIAETSASGGWMGGPPTYYYRLKGAAPVKPVLPNKNKIMPISTKGINYETHISKVGWMNNVVDGALSGSVGYKLPIEGFKIIFGNKGIDGSVEYRAHVAGVGWQGWKKSGTLAGTTGQSKAVEAIQVRLTGEAANCYDIEYQTHVATKGWQAFVKNGTISGTTGQKLAIEAMKVKINRKPITQGNKQPQASGLSYRSHLSEEGWLGFVGNNKLSGTTGMNISMEAIDVYIDGSKKNIQVDAHVSGKGWLSNSGGTTGEKRQLEAVRIKLKNELAKEYNIEYRTHIATKGWQPWVRDGAISGTTGNKLAVQAIQIRLVKK